MCGPRVLTTVPYHVYKPLVERLALCTWHHARATLRCDGHSERHTAEHDALVHCVWCSSHMLTANRAHGHLHVGSCLLRRLRLASSGPWY